MTVAGDQFTASKDVRPVIKEASPVSQEHHRVRHPAEGCEDPSTVFFQIKLDGREHIQTGSNVKAWANPFKRLIPSGVW